MILELSWDVSLVSPPRATSEIIRGGPHWHTSKLCVCVRCHMVLVGQRNKWHDYVDDQHREFAIAGATRRPPLKHSKKEEHSKIYHGKLPAGKTQVVIGL